MSTSKSPPPDAAEEAATTSSEPPPDGVPGLLRLIRVLRGPAGCPWDRAQTLATTAPHLLEEAHELAAELRAGEQDAIAEELGDLLFQVCFVACLLRDASGPDLRELAERVHAKMVDRHPHVFGGERLSSAKEVERAWGRRKASDADGSVLSGVPASLPALIRALRLGEKAAAVGFDWNDAGDVLAKVDEERTELAAAVASDDDPAIEEELGDLLFVLASFARHRGLDPERALQRANDKFARRFSEVEALLGDDIAPPTRPTEAAELHRRQRMEDAWNRVKARERAAER